ncbi:MAG TPA: SAM-dependent methyltransferase, partial [Actinomycetota bacterium]|nr:SAM-dependent methyltransferase [Actinomycetota bacterium]
MPSKARITLARLVSLQHPEVDAASEIRSGRVLVDGRIVNNPRSLIARGASVRLTAPAHLRGRDKLGPILAALAVEVKDRIALDVGAAAGGFTQALLEAGARRVYAVEVGHGQLLGSLRQNER